MNRIQAVIAANLLALSLGACSVAGTEEKGAAIGAATGAVVGNAVRGGIAFGIVGGAAVGGVIGHDVASNSTGSKS